MASYRLHNIRLSLGHDNHAERRRRKQLPSHREISQLHATGVDQRALGQHRPKIIRQLLNSRRNIRRRHVPPCEHVGRVGREGAARELEGREGREAFREEGFRLEAPSQW